MDAVITKNVYNSWIFQDPKKLKWWADLHHLADENGEIHMSLSDLSLRWNTPKTTVHRFLSKLASGTIDGTKVEHQVERIRIYKPESYEGAWNSEWNESGTDAKKGPSPPYNPLLSKENYNFSLNSACAREEKLAWDENKEMSFKVQFLAEGRIIASARKTGCDAIGINDYLERFMAHCQSVDFGHANIGHFGAHFNKFVEHEKSKPLKTSRNSQSTLDWNTQIAKDLGLL